MFEHRVSFRYAKAMLDLATERGIAESIYNEFEGVSLTLNMSRELRSLAASPVFQLNKKKKVFKEIFKEEHISDDLLNFLLMLIDKRRGDLIVSIAYQYRRLYDLKNNRLPVRIYSAVEIDESKKSMIIERISNITKKTVLPEFCIEPNLKGGLMLKIDDWVYDFTVKTQLDRIYNVLATGSKID